MTESEITLRDYIDVRIKNVEDKIDAQFHFSAQHFALNELAIKKAEESMLQRLEGMNEFREQIRDERGSLATKESMELILSAHNSRLGKLEISNSFSAGKMWAVIALFAIIPTIIAIIAFVRSV